jgi:hypothetical protein
MREKGKEFSTLRAERNVAVLQKLSLQWNHMNRRSADQRIYEIFMMISFAYKKVFAAYIVEIELRMLNKNRSPEFSTRGLYEVRYIGTFGSFDRRWIDSSGRCR